MGCCGSKQFESNRSSGPQPSAAEVRQKALDAAEERRKQNEMRGIQNPKTAQKLRAEAGAGGRVQNSNADVRHANQVSKDWANSC
mmetsp:Transcript_35553/g.77630  ORF Transcript_35553/g.77630 Transcript_35553/m.77630 type:complete len:85 (-) Transcript_35553:186-440(-)